jgi:hypothetical protein
LDVSGSTKVQTLALRAAILINSIHSSQSSELERITWERVGEVDILVELLMK